jgi:hypothetical protein
LETGTRKLSKHDALFDPRISMAADDCDAKTTRSKKRGGTRFVDAD